MKSLVVSVCITAVTDMAAVSLLVCVLLGVLLASGVLLCYRTPEEHQKNTRRNELDHFVSAKCAAWMYRMRRSSTFGKGARWGCALSLAGRAGCGAGSGIQTCAHGGKIP